MDSLKVSLSDIYNYCLKSKDFAYKSKFITCIYGKVENYLQEDNPEYSKAVLYDLNKFSDVMRSFKTPEHKTFLDVGSGNGEKVYAALCWGFENWYKSANTPCKSSYNKRKLTLYWQTRSKPRLTFTKTKM
jgi:hypothetical protein